MIENDRLSLELLPSNQGGHLRLTLAAGALSYTSDAGFNLADNRWHNIDLRFVDALLQLQIDQDNVVIANSSEIDASPLFRTWSDVDGMAQVTIGHGYVGCIREGPSVRLSVDQENNNIFIGACPIPLNGDCSEHFKFII